MPLKKSILLLMIENMLNVNFIVCIKKVYLSLVMRVIIKSDLFALALKNSTEYYNNLKVNLNRQKG